MCKPRACSCVVRAKSGPWHGLALGAVVGAQCPLCSPGWALATTTGPYHPVGAGGTPQGRFHPIPGGKLSSLGTPRGS